MNELAAKHLIDLVRDHGVGVVDDPRRMRSLLGDSCGELKREINVLVAAAECRVPADILGSAGTPWSILAARLAERLREDRAIAEPAAAWAVRVWADALGHARVTVRDSMASSTIAGGSPTSPGKATPAWAASLWSSSIGPWQTEFVRSGKWRQRLIGPRGAIVAALALVVCLIALAFPSGDDPEIHEDIAEIQRRQIRGESSTGYLKEVAEKGLSGWKRAASRGSPDGMYLYGRALEEGLAVPKDQAEAVRLYRKAALKGHVLALNNLGFDLTNGIGVGMDKQEAFRCFQEAANLGLPLSMTNLADAFNNGIGTREDKATAIEWYNKAAGLGHLPATRFLGILYLNGDGVPKNEAKGLELLKQAADGGFSEAMDDLGEYHRAWRTPNTDPIEAARWYRMGAQHGNYRSMWQLGDMLVSESTGIPREPVVGKAWLEKAFEKATDLDDRAQIQELIARNELLSAQKFMQNDRTEALRLLAHATNLYDEVNRQRPGRFYIEQDRAQCYHLTGVTLVAEGRPQEAASAFRKAVDMAGAEMTQASIGLAKLLEAGNGVTKDEAQAGDLRKRFESQVIKRFTVQCEVAKGRPRFPVHFYIYEYFPWKHPLETQERYFHDRGITVPKDVMDSFERIYNIAKENKVSFADLCVYALGDKDKASKAGESTTKEAAAPK